MTDTSVPALPAGFRAQTIATNDAEIHVRVGGKGPAVLLLHGYGETGEMWGPLAAALMGNRTVVVPDLRGYGDSGCPPSDPDHHAYSKRAMGDDMVAVMEALGFGQFAVVGHDRGRG